MEFANGFINYVVSCGKNLFNKNEEKDLCVPELSDEKELSDKEELSDEEELSRAHERELARVQAEKTKKFVIESAIENILKQTEDVILDKYVESLNIDELIEESRQQVEIESRTLIQTIVVYIFEIVAWINQILTYQLFKQQICSTCTNIKIKCQIYWSQMYKKLENLKEKYVLQVTALITLIISILAGFVYGMFL